jgi:site-specific recombinase XerD
MNSSSGQSTDLVPPSHNPSFFRSQLPEILLRAGKPAVFAAEEFFFARIRNEHTRQAYLIAVRRFLAWAEDQGLELRAITPRAVGQYMDVLRKQNTSVATRKQHLAALRHFFDNLVTRHAMVLNPAL